MMLFVIRSGSPSQQLLVSRVNLWGRGRKICRGAKEISGAKESRTWPHPFGVLMLFEHLW